MDSEERSLANRGPRSPTLRRGTILQRWLFLHPPEQWRLNANSMVGEWPTLEGAFVAAESHLLAAGKRDSARVLAEMMVDWSAGTNPGYFALHGILPYVPILFIRNHWGGPLKLTIFRHLQNGNILAARTFITHFTSSFTSKYPSFTSPGSSTLPIGSEDEIIVTSDPVLNFAQVAVRLCQRAQGDKSKLMRESWVRFCGTYQARGGVLATREIRKVGRLLR